MGAWKCSDEQARAFLDHETTLGGAPLDIVRAAITAALGAAWDELQQQRDEWQATAERIAKESPLKEEYDWACKRAEEAEQQRDAAMARATQAEAKVQDIAKACDEHFARGNDACAKLATAEREVAQLKSEIDLWLRYKERAEKSIADERTMRHGAEREREEARALCVELLTMSDDGCSLTRDTPKRALVESWRASARKDGAK